MLTQFCSALSISFWRSAAASCAAHQSHGRCARGPAPAATCSCRARARQRLQPQRRGRHRNHSAARRRPPPRPPSPRARAPPPPPRPPPRAPPAPLANACSTTAQLCHRVRPRVRRLQPQPLDLRRRPALACAAFASCQDACVRSRCACRPPTSQPSPSGPPLPCARVARSSVPAWPAWRRWPASRTRWCPLPA
jgi:hypothetical protein